MDTLMKRVQYRYVSAKNLTFKQKIIAGSIAFYMVAFAFYYIARLYT